MDVQKKQISYNWMLLDLVDLMHQSNPGHRVVPKPALKVGPCLTSILSWGLGDGE